MTTAACTQGRRPLRTCCAPNPARTAIPSENAHSANSAYNEFFTASGSNTKRSEEHTSELQSPCNRVCRLLLEKKKTGATAAFGCVLLRAGRGGALRTAAPVIAHMCEVRPEELAPWRVGRALQSFFFLIYRRPPVSTALPSPPSPAA